VKRQQHDEIYHHHHNQDKGLNENSHTAIAVRVLFAMYRSGLNGSFLGSAYGSPGVTPTGRATAPVAHSTSNPIVMVVRQSVAIPAR